MSAIYVIKVWDGAGNPYATFRASEFISASITATTASPDTTTITISLTTGSMPVLISVPPSSGGTIAAARATIEQLYTDMDAYYNQ